MVCSELGCGGVDCWLQSKLPIPKFPVLFVSVKFYCCGL